MQLKLLRHPGAILKAISPRSSFTPLLGGIEALGACVLLGIICLPVIIELLVNSQWKEDSEMHGVNLRILI